MLYQYTIIQINKLITVIRFRPRREKKFLQVRPGWLLIYQILRAMRSTGMAPHAWLASICDSIVLVDMHWLFVQGSYIYVGNDI